MSAYGGNSNNLKDLNHPARLGRTPHWRGWGWDVFLVRFKIIKLFFKSFNPLSADRPPRLLST